MTYRSSVSRKSKVKSPKVKVLILGLGQFAGGTGVSSAIYFAKQGADVLVTDLKTADKLGTNVKTLKRFKNVRFHLGENRIEDLKWADVIVSNPDIKKVLPIYKEAVRLGKPLINDITVFLEHTPCLTVGITGTRGKSTTTSWIGDMLKRSGKRNFVGGNITLSPLTFLEKLKPNDVAVIELSSWLLEPCGANGLSPDIAVWTNVMADHLNAYDGMEDYAEAKAQIMRNQGADGIFVANLDDKMVSSYVADAPGQVRGFSLKKKAGSNAWTSNGWLVLKQGKKIIRVLKIDKIGLRGAHNVLNALAAMVGADASGATLTGIKESLKNFGGVPYRQQIVAVKRGITFVNDTTSTTPDAAIAALNSFASVMSVKSFRSVRSDDMIDIRPDRPEGRSPLVHWICGGAHKGLDYSLLAKAAKGKNLDIHVLAGTAFDILTGEFKKQKIDFQKAELLKDAFDRAVGSAKRGDIVLLSPACASFGLFKNEFDRGDQFNVLVKKWR